MHHLKILNHLNDLNNVQQANLQLNSAVGSATEPLGTTGPQGKGGPGPVGGQIGVVQKQGGVGLAGEPLHRGHQILRLGQALTIPLIQGVVLHVFQSWMAAGDFSE